MIPNKSTLKFLGLFKKLVDGKATIEETIKLLLPITIKANPLVKMFGIPEKTEFEIKITTAQSDGKEWLAILFREKE